MRLRRHVFRSVAPQPHTEYQPLFGFGPEALDDANVQRDYVFAGNVLIGLLAARLWVTKMG